MVPSWFWGEKVKEKQPTCSCPDLYTITHPPTFPPHPQKTRGGRGGGERRKRKEECATNLGTCGICILIFPQKERKKQIWAC